MKVKDKDDEPEKDERFTGLITQEVLETQLASVLTRLDAIENA